jgi:hypothetical protein
MHAMTVATRNCGYLDALSESCEKAGVSIRILGANKKWLGFVWRYELIEKELVQLNNTGHGDELGIILDGYDTLVCSSGKDIATSHNRLCKDKGLDPKRTVVLAPEHHKDWCSPTFNGTIHRISKYIFDVPASEPFVLNAGVIVGTVNTLLQYTKRIKLSSVETTETDDQRILNKLWRNNGFQADNISIAIDLHGSVAYCHANRTLLSCLKSQLLDHNRHKIDHEIDLSMNDKGITIRRTGAPVGILHAISNADIDKICTHLNIHKLPTKRKPISQPLLRVLMVGVKTLSALIIMFFVVCNVLLRFM